MIELAGWSLLREGGSHSVYQKGGRQYPVPRHSEVKPGIVAGWKKLDKEIDAK